MTILRLPLTGPGGDAADLRRTLFSSGFADLAPMALDRGAGALEVTLPIAGARPRIVRIGERSHGVALVRVGRGPVGARVRAGVAGAVRHILRLDEDLSAFYALARRDPGLAWAAAGAGRMIRAPTVFEDVIKTLCTTNCSWAFTRRMVESLVALLGTPAPGAPPAGWRGRTFPSPEAMADAGVRCYRARVHAGGRPRRGRRDRRPGRPGVPRSRRPDGR